jgi:hypothetical protein
LLGFGKKYISNGIRAHEYRLLRPNLGTIGLNLGLFKLVSFEYWEEMNFPGQYSHLLPTAFGPGLVSADAPMAMICEKVKRVRLRFPWFNGCFN